jgi:hypothetical protein
LQHWLSALDGLQSCGIAGKHTPCNFAADRIVWKALVGMGNKRVAAQVCVALRECIDAGT